MGCWDHSLSCGAPLKSELVRFWQVPCCCVSIPIVAHSLAHLGSQAWEGWTAEWNTWEPASNIEPSLITDYEERQCEAEAEDEEEDMPLSLRFLASQPPNAAEPPTAAQPLKAADDAGSRRADGNCGADRNRGTVACRDGGRGG